MYKANDIAQVAGHNTYKVTDGWFYHWKNQYNLTFLVLKIESAEAL